MARVAGRGRGEHGDGAGQARAADRGGGAGSRRRMARMRTRSCGWGHRDSLEEMRVPTQEMTACRDWATRPAELEMLAHRGEA